MKPIVDSSTYNSFLSSFPKKRLSIRTPEKNPPLDRVWNFYTQKSSFQSFQSNKSNNVTANLVTSIEETNILEANSSLSTTSAPNSNVSNTSNVNNVETKSIIQPQDVFLVEVGSQIPIVFLSGLYSTSESYYEILLSLSAKGLQIVVADLPIVDSIEELLAQFIGFCEALGFEKIHLMGAEGGAFISQFIAQERPDMIASLCIINPFISNEHIAQVNIFPELIVSLTPTVILRKILSATVPSNHIKAILEAEEQTALTNEESTATENKSLKKRIARIAKSVQFIKQMIEKTPGKELSSNINLFTRKVYNTDPNFVNQNLITIIESLDQRLLSKDILNEIRNIFPNARYASIKYGGDFPQLGNSEEVIMHVLIHLRRATQKLFEPEDQTEEDQNNEVQLEEDKQNEGVSISNEEVSVD